MTVELTGRGVYVQRSTQSINLRNPDASGLRPNDVSCRGPGGTKRHDTEEEINYHHQFIDVPRESHNRRNELAGRGVKDSTLEDRTIMKALQSAGRLNELLGAGMCHSKSDANACAKL